MTIPPIKTRLKTPTIQRIATPVRFNAYRASLAELVAPYTDTLRDDTHPVHALPALMENLASTVPYLWLGIGEDGRILTGASLNDILPGRHAWLHGVSAPGSRRHPLVVLTALAALDFAFLELNVRKVKAEFDADNAGARGFCLRFGFRKEAHFKQDVCVSGQPRDVVVWSLFAHEYFQRIRRTIHHVVWQKEK